MRYIMKVSLYLSLSLTVMYFSFGSGLSFGTGVGGGSKYIAGGSKVFAATTTRWVIKETPILDGKMDKAYEKSYKTDIYNQYEDGVKLLPGQISFIEYSNGSKIWNWSDPIAEKSEVAGYMHMLWDSSYLYVFAQINDPTVVMVPDSYFTQQVNFDIVGPAGKSYHAAAVENVFWFTHPGYAGLTVKTRLEAFGRFAFYWHLNGGSAAYKEDYRTLVTPNVGYTVEYRTEVGKLKEGQIFEMAFLTTDLKNNGSIYGIGSANFNNRGDNFKYKLGKGVSDVMSGWYVENGKDVFYQNGTKVVNQLLEIGTKVFYLFDANGYLKTGLQIAPNGKTYFFDAVSGKNLVGVQNVNTKDKAYFNALGEMVKNSFVESMGSWYYAGENGLLLKSTSMVFNGVTIKFGLTGIISNGFYDINIAKSVGSPSSSASRSLSASSLNSNSINSGISEASGAVISSILEDNSVTAFDNSGSIISGDLSNSESSTSSKTDDGSKDKSGLPVILLIVGFLVLSAVVAAWYLVIKKKRIR